MAGCVACQPIFDNKMEVYGYELLYRESEQSIKYDGFNGDYATSNTIMTAFSDIGINKLTGGRKAFVNFTDKLLSSGVALLLSNDVLVIEILETAEISENLINTCKKLKKRGYLITLDDFVYSAKYEPLLKYIDIVKVDFLNLTEKEIIKTVQAVTNNRRRVLLAEKVETAEKYDLARKLGFSLFQGYFFSKPVKYTSKSVNPLKISQLQLMRYVNDPELNFQKLAEIIKRDLVLSCRLLKMVNSAYYGLKYSVNSILHALTILGLNDLKKWISLIVISHINFDKPGELIHMSLIRGRFMELTAKLIGEDKNKEDYFLMGLFSLVDVVMGAPMEVIIEETHLGKHITEPLIDGKGKGAQMLDIIRHYEKGEWDSAIEAAEVFSLTDQRLLDTYLSSVAWANEIFYFQ